MSAALFEQFRKNLAVRNEADISTHYREITKRLNKSYWESDSEFLNCLQVGSYGRQTAIHGISDLDMVFELPAKELERFKKVQGNGPSQMLQEVRGHLLERYPNTDIKGDGQVVVIEFAASNARVEVLPAFFNADDDSYTYGNSNEGGRWEVCKPRHEIAAVDTRNARTNRNYKRVCKMLRAWREAQGAPMSGMLIDTLAYNFFTDNQAYDQRSYAAYPELARDVFAYLAGLDNQDYWLAPGSNQRVKAGGNFQRKAKAAAEKCDEALAADSDKKKAARWRDVFGTRYFPSTPEVKEAYKHGTFQNTEQFIENSFPMDIQYDLDIDCEIASSGQYEARLRALGRRFPWLSLNRSLRFYISSCNVPGPYAVFWKVRNVGEVAERRNEIRGQIVADAGKNERVENTKFQGPHFVECYVVKNGFCVARDRIEVPIGDH